jgi:hypothetical protein
MNYAILDENKIVVGVSQLSGRVDSEKMIEISEYDGDLIGKEWNGVRFVGSSIKKRALAPPLE